MRKYIGLGIIVALLSAFVFVIFSIFEMPKDCEAPKTLVLPNHAHIGKTVYEVKIVHPEIMKNNLGTCEYVKKIISIRAGQTKESEGIIFVHEILHAVFWEGEIPLWKELQEEIVKRIAPLLYHALSSHTIFQ